MIEREGRGRIAKDCALRVHEMNATVIVHRRGEDYREYKNGGAGIQC